MKRKLIALAMSICIACSVTGCSMGAKDEAINLSFAINFADDHQVTQGYKAMAAAVEEKSEGRLTITIYPGEQLGATNSVLALINTDADSVDMTCTSTGALATYNDQVGIFDAPYIFNDEQQMLNFAKSDAAAAIWDDLAETQNLRNIGTLYYGARYLTSNVAATTPADMNNCKIRVPDEPMALAYGAAMGGAPTPLAFGEVYLALSQNVVSAQENPLTSIISGKFYEVCDYLIPTKHVIGNQVTIINEKVLNELPDDLRDILLTEAQNAATALSDEIKSTESANEQFLIDSGMELIQPDVDAFRDACAGIYDDYIDVWGADLLAAAQQ